MWLTRLVWLLLFSAVTPLIAGNCGSHDCNKRLLVKIKESEDIEKVLDTEVGILSLDEIVAAQSFEDMLDKVKGCQGTSGCELNWDRYVTLSICPASADCNIPDVSSIMEKLLVKFGDKLEWVQQDVPVKMNQVPPVASQGESGTPAEVWASLGLENLSSELKSKGVTSQSRRSLIAVIDTGADFHHPFFGNSRFTPMSRLVTGPPFTLEQAGWNAITNEPLMQILGLNTLKGDIQGHGTHCAGIIAARPDWGEVGGSRIMPIRAFKAEESCLIDIVFAVALAVDRCADVISMSFSTQTNSPALESVLRIASHRSILVAAAGNDGQTRPPQGNGATFYPAAYDFVLGVEATDSNGDLANFSNRGYDIQAPGVCINSTIPGGQYARMSGTSMATPFVSAFAGFLRFLFPNRRPYEIQAALKNYGLTAQAAILLASTQFMPMDPSTTGAISRTMRAPTSACPQIPEHLLRLYQECPGLDLRPKVEKIHIVGVKGPFPMEVMSPETYRVQITFDQAMRTDIHPVVSFGKKAPFRDYYLFPNEWDDTGTTWTGTLILNQGVDSGVHSIAIGEAVSEYSCQENLVYCQEFIDVFNIQNESVSANSTNSGIEIDAGPPCPETQSAPSSAFGPPMYDPIVGYRIELIDNDNSTRPFPSDRQLGDFIFFSTSPLKIPNLKNFNPTHVQVQYVTVAGKVVHSTQKTKIMPGPNHQK